MASSLSLWIYFRNSFLLSCSRLPCSHYIQAHSPVLVKHKNMLLGMKKNKIILEFSALLYYSLNYIFRITWLIRKFFFNSGNSTLKGKIYLKEQFWTSHLGLSGKYFERISLEKASNLFSDSQVTSKWKSWESQEIVPGTLGKNWGSEPWDTLLTLSMMKLRSPGESARLARPKM